MIPAWNTTNDDGDAVCPVCERRIAPGESVGGRGRQVLHLACYLAEREKKRRE